MKPARLQTVVLSLTFGVLAACGNGPSPNPTVQLSLSPNPVQEGHAATLAAQVSSLNGTAISNVEFYAAQTLLGEDSSSPYELQVPMNGSASGKLVFSARATDQANLTGVTELFFDVEADTQAPTVTLTSDKMSITHGGKIGGQLHGWGGFPNFSAGVPQPILVGQGRFLLGSVSPGSALGIRPAPSVRMAGCTAGAAMPMANLGASAPTRLYQVRS